MPASTAGRPPADGLAIGRRLLCPVLVDREPELAVLTSALAGSAETGDVAVVLGEGGVGKTRLAQVVAAHAGQGGSPVLAGRAVPGGVPVPYRPLTDAFLAAFRSGMPTAAPELAGFGGHLKRLVPDWPADATGGADESPVLLGEAVLRLLEVLGGPAPALLLLEDLHWADAETLAVVEYLADALPAARAWCLCTARPDTAVNAVVERLRRRPDAIVLGLHGLSAAGCRHGRPRASDSSGSSPTSGPVRSPVTRSRRRAPCWLRCTIRRPGACGASLRADGCPDRSPGRRPSSRRSAPRPGRRREVR